MAENELTLETLEILHRQGVSLRLTSADNLLSLDLSKS